MRVLTCLATILMMVAAAVFAGCGISSDGQSAGPATAGQTDNQTNQPSQTGGQEVGAMKLTSNMFNEGEKIPDKYTCKGLDINPPLMIEAAPEGTKSFALIVDDPDAPVGLWTHWMVKDIRPDINVIAEQSVPGIEVVNSAGRKNYHGPCPPSGTHRYYFKLYALDVASMKATTKAEFYLEVEKHRLAMASLMGRYSKA
jgi:Raf kinase inhibitor-like YbhB/YbcL family protein